MTQKIYQKYYSKVVKQKKLIANDFDQIDATEQLEINKIYQKTLLKAAILGLLGVVLYFLPIHLFPEIFPFYEVKDLLGFSFRLEYGQIIYGIVLMILELHLLVLINIKSVHQLANTTGFYQNNSQNENFLLQLGLGSKELGLNQFGIDPYQEVNKKLLVLFNFLLKLKGFLANKLLQYVFKRLMGRYAVRYAVDYVGIPIYMFLNALGAYTVLNEAKICILGTNLVQKFMSKITVSNLTNKDKNLIYDTLQLIAMSKRDYHRNHYLLTQLLFEKFDILPEKKRIFTEQYYKNLTESTKEVQELCNKIIVLGFILDGKISRFESQKLKILNEKGLLNHNIDILKKLSASFRVGKVVEL